MLELVAETEPGPFLNRAVELGDYLGIRCDGALVAMAGERLRFDGWTEISGVCTMPTHRGHGLASGLVGALIAGTASLTTLIPTRPQHQHECDQAIRGARFSRTAARDDHCHEAEPVRNTQK
jgi:hypothetical protein